MKENGYELDITDKRYHHEIYLSDPRKCDVSKLKTVIRHPIKKINSNSFHASESWNPNMAEKDKNSYQSIKARARFKRPVYHLTCEKVM